MPSNTNPMAAGYIYCAKGCKTRQRHSNSLVFVVRGSRATVSPVSLCSLIFIICVSILRNGALGTLRARLC
jgi:hypothetical protein